MRTIQIRKTFKPVYQGEANMSTKLHPALKMTYMEKIERGLPKVGSELVIP